MPVMDGYEAIGRIRALPEGSKLPVLVVTASGFSDERDQALAAGADGCVLKPVPREQLLEEIGRIAGAHYEYEAPPPAVASPAALDSAALAQLPAEQRLLLDQALRRGDIRQLRATVAAIASERAELAAGIGVLVNAYDYDGLRRLLISQEGKTL
jgi:DNA-binding response OmpR family regulator